MSRSHARFSTTVPYELKDGDFVSYIEELHQLALQQRLAGKPLPPSMTGSYESPQDSFAKIRSQHQRTMDALHHSAQQRPQARPSTLERPQPSRAAASMNQGLAQGTAAPVGKGPRLSEGMGKSMGSSRPPLSANARREVEQQIRKLHSLQGATTVFGLFTLALLLSGDLYFPGNLIVLAVFIVALGGFIFALVKGKSLRRQL